MLSQKSAILVGAIMLLTGPAGAQIVSPLVVQRQDASVRVQNNFNFFVPGPNNDSEESRKSRDNARRAIYEMAAKECDLLREVLAKDCRLESVSSNVNRQFGPQQPEGFTINGSMSLLITVK
jgi:hypothetical protein